MGFRAVLNSQLKKIEESAKCGLEFAWGIMRQKKTPLSPGVSHRKGEKMTKSYKNQQEPKKHNLNKASPHDKFFKGWYSEPAFARELLQLIFTQEEQQVYDFNRLKTEKDTLPEGKQADLVFSMPLKNSPHSTVRIFILLEHKSKYDPKLFTQLLNYQALLHEQSMRGIGQACPIIPVVFYHGQAPWRGPKTFQEACLGEDTAKIPAVFKKYMVNYEIKLLNTHDPILRRVFKDKNFKSRGALYLLSEIWRLRAKGVSLKDIEELLREFWIKRQDLVSGSINYLKATGVLSDERWETIEREAANKGLLTKGGIMGFTETLTEKARMEGIQQGMQKNQQAVILNMLKKKLDTSLIAEVTGLPEKEIKKLQNSS